MIFGNGIYEEWLYIKGLIEFFCSAFGMTFGLVKLCFKHWDMEENLLTSITNLFHIQSDLLDVGISYPGFFLKPDSYMRSDWF